MTEDSTAGGLQCENCGADLVDEGCLVVDVLDRTVHVKDPGRTHQSRPGEPISTVYVCDRECRRAWWSGSRWSGDREIGWCVLDTRRDTE